MWTVEREVKNKRDGHGHISYIFISIYQCISNDRRGMHPVTAPNGFRSPYFGARASPDVIFLDVVMTAGGNASVH
jgi:hypothetical protein